MSLTAAAQGQDPFVAIAERPAFEEWWNRTGEWVETPNQRRRGWSGVMRVRHQGALVYVKRQQNHQCRTLDHPLGWPTASREFANFKRVAALDIQVPEVIYHGSRRARGDTRAVLVTRALEGFRPLAEQTDLDDAQRSLLAARVGATLGRLHAARLQHSCLYDKHIMVRWRDNLPDIALIDLEKMRRRLSTRAAARHDLDQLCRHQSIWTAGDWQTLECSHALSVTEAALRHS